MQYPIIEALNGSLWVLTFALHGISIVTGIYCLMISGLLVLSVIDWRTYEIPFGINVYLFVLGAAREVIEGLSLIVILDFLLVSGFLMLVYIITKGKGIGGGDIKLMAVAGLLLGWKLVLVAFIFGCFYGSILHIIRMKISKADRVLALGPYLSVGMLTAVWYGDKIIAWYTTSWIQ